jgi:NAD(P)-dependent dehydrogenase (short-subunit alcohol dehydrogenase family)
MDLGLKGKVVIVTGGARGIGAGCCEVLAEEGANLVVNYRSDPQECEAFIKGLIDKYHIQAAGVQADVGLPAGREKIMDTAMNSFGTVDGLVNNAAYMPTSRGRGLLNEVTDECWAASLEVNITAPKELTKKFVEICRSQNKGGRIVNIIAKAVYSLAEPGLVAYGSTKAALAGFTRIVAKELARYKIIVNGVAPGYVNSHSVNFEADTPGNRMRREKLPTGIFGQPRDIGDTVAYLLSSRASQIIGVVVDTTGGLLL